VKAFGTPRRLVVLVDAMSSKQLEEEVEVRGPPASKAFDDEGNPTKAAEGFSRRYGVPLEKLYRKVSGKTEYVHARVTEPARLALEVLFLYSFCYAKGLLFSSFMKDLVYPLT
jgi:glycyl-tRNA synthetase